MDKERIFIEGILRQSISDDYTNTVLEQIYDDVLEDIRTSADKDYNEDDVRLAFGRVISKRLTQTTTKVYKVFDDEWEEIMGDEQIRFFAIDQLHDKAEDFIKEAKEGYQDEEDGKALETLYNKVVSQNYTKLTLNEIRLIFNAFDFNFEELNVR